MRHEMAQTKVIKIDRASFKPEDLKPAVEAIEAGKLVVFPTETVYGIAADATNEQAIKNLAKLKSRPPEKPFTLHIGELSELREHVGSISPMGRFLVKKYWPGPLTIVFPPPSSRARKLQMPRLKKLGLGVRYPSDPVAQALIQAAEVPLVAPSANLEGAPPAITGEQALEQLGGRVAFLVDAGPTALRKPSTVVRAGKRQLDVLREGAIPASELQALRLRTILFVCTGNSCRSPMAEALAKMALASKLGVSVEELEGMGFQIFSAGTAAFSGARASAEAAQAMHERGFDLSRHVSKEVTADMVEDADMVLVMSQHHMETIRNISPKHARKVHLLCPGGVADPIGQPVEVYRETADRIEKCLQGFLEQFISGNKESGK